MLEKIEGLPSNVVGVQAIGAVSEKDYLQVIEPLVDQARREGRTIRFVYQFGPEFDHMTSDGAWEDAKLGLTSLRVFEGCAVVTDVPWIRQSVNLARFLVPCPVRVFANAELAAGAAWLESLPESGGLSHRLLSDFGVLVVEPHGPLRAVDFDALARVVDPWIADHGELHGLVIHAPEFPGWKGLSGFVRHVKFLEDHHRKIRRVALAADSKFAELIPKIAERFSTAEIQHFGYADVEAAIAWASAGC
jgi:hypothetical protein